MLKKLKSVKIGGKLIIWYKNWKGEESYREILVKDFVWGASPYHEGTQMFIRAIDLKKKTERDFAIVDIKEVVDFTTTEEEDE